jgi:hypothetical protein
VATGVKRYNKEGGPTRTPQEPKRPIVSYTLSPPSFPRTRESRLSTSQIVESLDSRVRENDEGMDLTGSAHEFEFKGKRPLFPRLAGPVISSDDN